MSHGICLNLEPLNYSIVELTLGAHKHLILSLALKECSNPINESHCEEAPCTSWYKYILCAVMLSPFIDLAPTYYVVNNIKPHISFSFYTTRNSLWVG